MQSYPKFYRGSRVVGPLRTYSGNIAAKERSQSSRAATQELMRIIHYTFELIIGRQPQCSDKSREGASTFRAKAEGPPGSINGKLGRGTSNED